MKIAIMTLRLHANYGGILQCYALQNMLKQLGHEVEVLDIRIPEERLSNKKKIKYYTKRLYERIFLKKKIPIFLEEKINSSRIIREQNTRKFITDNITLSKKKYIYKEDFINTDFSNYDAIVVGSDQVWRPSYSWPSLYSFFLDFAKNTKLKKVAYAASFGTNKAEYTPEQIYNCKKLIKNFTAVSVRENSAIYLIKEIYKWDYQNVAHVLDPTLLLDKNIYIQLFNNNIQKQKYIFSYILDKKEDITNLEKIILSKFNLPIKTISLEEDNLLNPIILPKVEEWLEHIFNAEFIITDSFHGCVFSIIFNKPFIVIANQARGYDRFASLLQLFNLEKRIIDKSQSSLEQSLLDFNINWQNVNNILKNERKKSIDFIIKSLS